MKLNTKSLAEVELGTPVIAEGLYHAKITKPEVKANKTGDGNNLVVQVQITDPVIVTKDGKEINNRGGIKLTRHISLKPTDTYDPNQRLKELAVAIGHPADQDLELEDLAGKPVMVKVGIRPAEGAYAESNDLVRFSKRADDDLFEDPSFGN